MGVPSRDALSLNASKCNGMREEAEGVCLYGDRGSESYCIDAYLKENECHRHHRRMYLDVPHTEGNQEFSTDQIIPFV